MANQIWNICTPEIRIDSRSLLLHQPLHRLLEQATSTALCPNILEGPDKHAERLETSINNIYLIRHTSPASKGEKRDMLGWGLDNSQILSDEYMLSVRCCVGSCNEGGAESERQATEQIVAACDMQLRLKVWGGSLTSEDSFSSSSRPGDIFSSGSRSAESPSMAPGTLLGSLSFVEGSSSAVLMALMSYSPKHVSDIAAFEKRLWHTIHRSQIHLKCLILSCNLMASGQFSRNLSGWKWVEGWRNIKMMLYQALSAFQAYRPNRIPRQCLKTMVWHPLLP